MEITVDQMYQIENKGHDMGFLKKFMMGMLELQQLDVYLQNSIM